MVSKVRMVTEIEGREYEFKAGEGEQGVCDGCDLFDDLMKPCKGGYVPLFDGHSVCVRWNGIWKEVAK